MAVPPLVVKASETLMLLAVPTVPFRVPMP
jgi:hypothetical protein